MTTNIATRKSRKTKPIDNFIKAVSYRENMREDSYDNEFLQTVTKVRQEMADAENFFDNVTEPELVDHAIYKMEAAKSKYIYLLKQAKEKGIFINL